VAEVEPRSERRKRPARGEAGGEAADVVRLRFAGVPGQDGAQDVVPVGVQVVRRVELEEVAAQVAVRLLGRDARAAVERLVDVAGQVQHPGEMDRPLGRRERGVGKPGRRPAQPLDDALRRAGRVGQVARRAARGGLLPVPAHVMPGGVVVLRPPRRERLVAHQVGPGAGALEELAPARRGRPLVGRQQAREVGVGWRRREQGDGSLARRLAHLLPGDARHHLVSDRVPAPGRRGEGERRERGGQRPSGCASSHGFLRVRAKKT